MLLFLCITYGSAYRNYLIAKFERPDSAISFPLMVGTTFVSGALVVPLIKMTEPVMPLWLSPLLLIYGALNLWLMWRMTGVRYNVRYGYIRA